MAQLAINKFCPRSGKDVQADSLTTYKGHVVGFCNPGCSGDFTANPENCPKDRAYFDTLLKEYELVVDFDVVDSD
ncbi:YHS domain-containing protein [Leptothoe sp. PORK10 BA2]|uniref:YHS domain-containing protein n=1 Tax=Leptothoe sp. PORK10 BA2 TaxID=3110254 RepID=UPI002B216570|nr:YHS domain-containing protein [Leptothoe sp. PORK10 BA2]MEA5462296.1 YHS domain-containing protein [Leptothoe sp. PORK10 BA2]